MVVEELADDKFLDGEVEDLEDVEDEKHECKKVEELVYKNFELVKNDPSAVEFPLCEHQDVVKYVEKKKKLLGF